MKQKEMLYGTREFYYFFATGNIDKVDATFKPYHNLRARILNISSYGHFYCNML